MPDSVSLPIWQLVLAEYFTPVFDTITTIYENWECDVWVCLILNKLLALQFTIFTFLFHILKFFFKEISRLPISSLCLHSSLSNDKSKLNFLPKNTSKGLLSFPSER